jgi:hypothetical protein
LLGVKGGEYDNERVSKEIPPEWAGEELPEIIIDTDDVSI